MRRTTKLAMAGLGLAGLLAVPVLAHAAPASPNFNVDAATRAWLNTLQGPARAKSDAYFVGGYWIALWGTLVGVLVDWLALRFRLSAAFRNLGERLSKRRSVIVAVTAVCYTAWGIVIGLPWSIYSGFAREKQYGLMNQTIGGWLGEQAIGWGLALVLGTLAIMAIYAVIRRFPRNWWLAGSGVIALFMFVGMLLGPVYIAPLFNHYTELPQGPIRDRIVAMAKANHVPADHIYLFDASKQSKRISANVSGVGPTIRISLNDNLLNRSTPQEVAAVMGHELGHYVLGHVWRNIVFMTLIFSGVLFLTSRIAPAMIARWGERWGVRDIADPASLPVVSICVGALFYLATPLTNTLIRIDESEADAFGLNAAREPDAFASVAMKLSEYRKIEPGPIEEALFYDHPSGATRVRMAMEWKKDHVKDAQIVVPPPMEQDFGKK